jgi:hypothetical protein
VIAGVIGGVIGIVATVLCGGLVLFAMRKRSSTVNHNRSIPMTMTGTSPSPQPQSQRDIYGAATGTLATGSAIDDYQSVGSSSNASYARLPMRDVQANYASGDIEILR